VLGLLQSIILLKSHKLEDVGVLKASGDALALNQGQTPFAELKYGKG